MKNILISLIFICGILNADSLIGKKYDNSITLKNEVLHVKKKTQEQNSFLPTLANTNDMYENLNLKDDYLCPIKDVKISKYKKWLGFVEYENGDIIALSSPKYTFAYLNKNPENIKNIYVTDYETEKIIDAKKAFYVFGSKIASVGGDDVVPFEKEEDAKVFLEKNSGKNIYKYERMDKKFIDYLEMR